MAEKKIRILLFTDWFLPGTASGGPVRSLTNMMHHMVEIADFKVVTRNTDYVSTQIYKTVASDSWNRIFKNVEVYYSSESNTNLSNFKSIIRSLEFDVLYINGIYSFKFSILPLIIVRNLNIRKVVGARGMLNQQAFSVKKAKKRGFLFLANKLKLYSDVYFHATNKDEADSIKSRIKSYRDIIIAANFPRQVKSFSFRPKKKTSKILDLVSIARISKEKGTLKMIQYLSKMTEGSICLHLYGAIYDKKYWLDCTNAIKQLPHFISVEYKGSVDGSLIPEILKNYHFFMMPSEGENFGHSILEALSAGLPVIISKKTPWKNLESKQVGWDIALDDFEKFKDVLNKCLEMKMDEYEKWSGSAQKYAKDFINNPKILEDNKRLFFN